MRYKQLQGKKRIFDVSCNLIRPLDKENNLLIVIHDITIDRWKGKGKDVIGFVAHEVRITLGNIVLCHEIMSESLKENNREELNDMLQRSKQYITSQ